MLELPYVFSMSSPNWALKPLNRPNVMTYMSVMIQVSGLVKMSICRRKFAFTGTSLSMVNAKIVARMVHGTKTMAILCTHKGLPAVCCGAIHVRPRSPKPMSHGPSN